MRASAQDGKFPLPLTQSQFGAALGLSLVHVSRTLQQLRRDRLIELKPGPSPSSIAGTSL
jgi:DNA-binding transcriptional regulator LsrR (DeoR family)